MALRNFITLGEPLHNNVTGDAAYVVVPATMTFKLRGQGHSIGRGIYCGASQARRRMAISRLGLGERHPSIKQATRGAANGAPTREH